MVLWVDKYRPNTLSELSYHTLLSERLTSMASDGEIPHLLFYGPQGAGKKTRISALLREIYGPASQKLRLDTRTFTTPSKKSIEINMISSNYHIEMTPGDAGIYDRYVVGSVIKEIAQNTALHKKEGTKASFKIVVLNEVDKLSKQAQAGLRRTMEKYTSVCRLVLCCNNQSKVIEPLRSRCLGIRVSAPTVDQVASVLQNIAKKESITIPSSLSLRVAKQSGRNVRRAILMMEACKVKGGALTDDSVVLKTDWEDYICLLAKEITNEQSPAKLLAAREKLYELIVNCIPSEIILKTLTVELLKNVDDSLRYEIVEWAAFYEHRLSQGSKDIFHLEAFVAKYMSIYKMYLTSMFG